MIDLIAQASPFADQPSEGLDFVVFLPLIPGILLYGLLAIIGRVLEGREHPGGQGALDAAFLVLLALAAYAIVLLVFAVVGEPGLIADLAEVVAIVIAFFAALILVLLFAEESVASLARRRRDGR